MTAQRDELAWVTRGSSWRSPALAGLDSPRLHALLDDIGCDVHEALEEEEHAVHMRRQLERVLHELLARESGSRDAVGAGTLLQPRRKMDLQ